MGRLRDTFAKSIGIHFCLLSFLSGCDANVQVVGHVKAPDGTAIDGALVTLEPAPGFEKVGKSEQRKTWEDGRFRAGFAYRPMKAEFILRVEKDGYVTHEERIFPSHPYPNHTVILRPIPQE